MRRHARRGDADPREPGAPRTRHPVVFTVGLLLVLAVVGGAGYTGWWLYSDLTWRATAEETAAGVAEAIRAYSVADDEPPDPVDAVAGSPGPGQVALDSLPYAEALPRGISRFRLSDGGALSVLTSEQALCSGATFDMAEVGAPPRGAVTCDDATPPQQPATLVATPRDRSVLLDWTHPFAPVEDYRVSVSADGGTMWAVVDDGVTSSSQAIVRSLENGRTYAFSVIAVNLVGESPPALTTASPLTEPGPPVGVTATGEFTAQVAWRPPADDGGRPITGYVVSGDPAGSCEVPATQTSCEIGDLPAAPGYTFVVRAINEAGAGTPSTPTVPISVFSVPGRPVALDAAPGDRTVILTWTPPLQDGNTPITDYAVEYRAVGTETWIGVPHEESTQTTRVVPGLVNGTEYEFQVRAINAVGSSDPPLRTARQTPATVPGPMGEISAVEGDGFVTLTWAAPALDGDSPITDYLVEYRSTDTDWLTVDDPVGTVLTSDVLDLVNGTRYAFRVSAVNRMGAGPASPRVLAMPVGPPGPVREPEAVGSLTDIELSWKPPANDGGRPLLGYRVDYRLSSSPDWIRVARLSPDQTSVVVGDLVGGESYDVRIVAISAAGFGPPAPGGLDRPTLAGVIADETPPAPEGLTAVPGDRQVTLTWQESPAGKKSPITAYTVTGEPGGSCTTTELTCTISGLTNGVRYTFTVNAANANITGEESAPVSAMPMVFNEASGGVVTTYTSKGRTYRVHRFDADGTFTIGRAEQPFTVLVVGGGGGSTVGADGTVYPGGGGGVIDARRIALPVGTLAVTVGAGGPAGLPGAVSALGDVGTAPSGTAGSPTQTEFSPTVPSGITGRIVTYGGAGTPTSGQGKDGRGMGGGGPTASRGGNGVVIIRYEVAR